MNIDFSDILDGAVIGTAELQLSKAEMAMAGDKPVINANYTIIEGEMQGPNKDIDPAGEFVRHTVWLPSSVDDASKVVNKKKMLKGWLTAHGIDTTGQLDLDDAIAELNSMKPVVKATLDVDNYTLEKTGESRTSVKRFYAID